MQKDAHESGNSNELGLKTTGKEMKKLLNKMWKNQGKLSTNGEGLEKEGSSATSDDLKIPNTVTG